MMPSEVRAEVWKAFDQVSTDGGKSAKALDIIDYLCETDTPIIKATAEIKRQRIRQLVCKIMLQAYDYGLVTRETYSSGRPGARKNVIWRRTE